MTKFERDKVYKTRDGREVRIVAVDGPKSQYGYWPIVGWLVDDSDGHVRRWGADGSYDANIPHMDLMLPKPEPVVEWGLHQLDGSFLKFFDEECARKNMNCHTGRLAKRTTEIVE